MKSAEKGRKIKIRFLIKLDDGSVVGTPGEKSELSFTIGQHNVLPGLEEGVLGMRVSEERTITIPADEGYGQYNKELVLRVDREHFPEDVELKPGRTVQYQNRDGERVNLVVNDV
ncbi:MAG: FKBP-type peptidyl-prolyl cis-trans isomerase, partial [Deltaproteobacteria bacterium]|nr:FKBP-type peptidyl-prolyl cis-trans isomerase [Deltaproteobacteria bacterium]